MNTYDISIRGTGGMVMPHTVEADYFTTEDALIVFFSGNERIAAFAVNEVFAIIMRPRAAVPA